MGTGRYFITSILYNTIWLALFYGIFVAPTRMFFRLGMYELLPMWAGVFFYFFFLRRWLKPVVLFVPAHFVALFVVWHMGPTLPLQVFYVATVVLLTVFSFIQRYRPALTFSYEFSYFSPIVLIALTLLAIYQGHNYMAAHYAALIIITSVGGRLQTRMAHVNSTLEIITQNSTQPVKKILSFDYKAVFVLGMVLVGLVVALHVFVVRPAMEAAIGLLPEFTPAETPDFIPEPTFYEPLIQMEMSLLPFVNERPPNVFLRFLERFVLYLIFPAILLAILVLIFRAVREFLIQLGLKKSDEQDLADGFADIKEFIRTPKIKRSWFFGPRNEHSLRRRFRETVTRHMKKGAPIQKSDTPAQMVEKIRAEDISGLAEEYVAVRYGG